MLDKPHEVGAAERWIAADNAVFREKFNRKSFEVSHNLAELPRALLNFMKRSLP
jgi:hypothetical protein